VQIERIERIQEHRIFHSWTPSDDPPDFKPITLIYGENGCGKSSLASLLHPDSSPEAWAAGVTVKVRDAGKSRRVTTADDPWWQKVVVFDSDYVQRAIRVKAGSTDALLALGEDAVERQRQREEAEARLQKAHESSAEAEAKKRLAVKAQEEAGTRIAREIQQVLRERPSFTSYTRANVVRDMANATSAAGRANLDRSELQARATARAEDPIGARAAISAPTTALVDVTSLLIEQPAVATTDLGMHTLVERDWIEQGTHLHEVDQMCMFCGGPVTAVRLRELQSALEAARSDLASRARTLKAAVDHDLEVLSSEVQRLPANKARTHVDLRARYDEARSSLTTQITELHTSLTRASAVLDLKSRDSHAAPELVQPHPGTPDAAGETTSDWPPVDVTTLNAVIDEHDTRCANFQIDSDAAAKAFTHFVLGDYHQEWTTLSAKWESADSAVIEAATALETARVELAQLAGGRYDLGKGVRWINTELSRLTGRDDIRLEVADDGQQYSITRDGAHPGDLSEGEKTALALVHFLGSLMNNGRPTQDLCVVIDDPISSLDGNIATGASAVLWGELVARTVCPRPGHNVCSCPTEGHRMRVGQVILLTHSFELFKRWSNNIDQLRNADVAQGRDSQQLELRTRWASDPQGTRRVPYWSVFGTDKQSRKRLRSEYAFLFDRCAGALVAVRTGTAEAATQLEVQSLLPNAGRRILESFLSYRQPENLGQTFYPRLLAALPEDGDATTRTALRNHLNNWSHYEEAAMDDPVERPDAITMMQFVFSFIHALDPRHFHGMCTSLNRDRWDLLLLPVGRTQSADDPLPLSCGRDGCVFALTPPAAATS